MKSLIHEMESCVSAISQANLEESILVFEDLYKQIKKEFKHVQSFKTGLGKSIISIIEGITFSEKEFKQLYDSLSAGNLDEAKTIVTSKVHLPAVSLVNGWASEIKKLADRLEKKIEFKVETDKKITLPKQLVKELNSSLAHLYRNCVDHGIEDPELRKSEGKPEVGTLSVSIQQENESIVVEIADDGKGIDGENIINKAKKNSSLDQAKVKKYANQKEYFEVLCMPGFSGKEGVTDISGRGIGMDAVKNSLESLNGKIEMFSEKNQYTKFRVEIPL